MEAGISLKNKTSPPRDPSIPSKKVRSWRVLRRLVGSIGPSKWLLETYEQTTRNDLPGVLVYLVPSFPWSF